MNKVVAEEYDCIKAHTINYPNGSNIIFTPPYVYQVGEFTCEVVIIQGKNRYKITPDEFNDLKAKGILKKHKRSF